MGNINKKQLFKDKNEQRLPISSTPSSHELSKYALPSTLLCSSTDERSGADEPHGPTGPGRNSQQFAAPVEPVKLYNKDVKYRFTKTNGERAILLSNVELPHALDVRSPTLRFKRGEPNIRGEMAFRFTPDGNDHVVRVMINEDPIHTLRLSPKLPKVKFFKNGGKKLLIKNLFKPNNLRLASDNKITWNLQPHPTLKHAYVLNFDPHGQVHNVELSLINNKGERQLIRRGKMKLAPKNKP